MIIQSKRYASESRPAATRVFSTSANEKPFRRELGGAS